MLEDQKPEPPKEREESAWALYGRYSHVALALPAAVVAGLFIGALLDRWLHTHWITLIGLILGAIAGFAEIVRALTQLSKEK